MAQPRFFLSPDEVNAFRADQWEHTQLTQLADTWEQQALSRIGVWATPVESAVQTLTQAGQPTRASEPPAVSAEPSQPSGPSTAPQGFNPDLLDLSKPAPVSPDVPLPSPSTSLRAPSPARPVAAQPSGGLVDYARQAAQRAGIDPDLFVRQINQESGFDPTAGSPKGALGIAQIVPKWHPNVDPTDPVASLDYAANLMASHLKTYGGDIRKALVAYNGGQGAVNAMNAGTPYSESSTYLDKILGSGDGPTTQDPNKVTAFQTGNWEAIARSQLGDPYVWGSQGGRQDMSDNPSGFDCSGFVSWVYNKGLGLNLPAFTGSIQQVTQSIRPDEARPGDLVMLMNSSDPTKQHVGIYIGNGQMINSTGGGVQIGAVWDGMEYRRDPRVQPGQGVDLLSSAVDTAMQRPATDQEQARGEEVRQSLAPTRDESVSNPFGEAFRQVSDVVGGIGNAAVDALRGAGQVMQQGQDVQTAGAVQAVDTALNAPAQTIRSAGATVSGSPLIAGQVSQAQGLTEAAQLETQTAGDIAAGKYSGVNDVQVMTDLADKYPSRVPGLPDFAAMTPEDRRRYNEATLAVGGMTMPSNPEGGLGKLIPGRKLSADELSQTAESLGQSWADIDRQALDLESRAGSAFNPGLRAQLNNQAARLRAQQADIMRQVEHIDQHGELPPRAPTIEGLAESIPEPTARPPSVEPATPSPRTPASASAILSSPNYRRLQAMRGTPEQQAALRPAEEGFAGNINLEKTITPDDVKQALRRNMEQQGGFAGQRRGVITDVEADQNAAAKALTMAPEDWIKTKPGRAFNQEEALALGNQLVKTGNEYSEMRAALPNFTGTADELAAAQAATAEKALELALLEGVRSGAASEAGRALRSFRQALTGVLRTKDGDTSKAFRAALKAIGADEEKYAEWVKAWDTVSPEDTIGRYKLLQALHQPTRMQKLTAWTTSNMLSGTKTLEVNLVGGAIETLNRPAIELLGGRPVDAWTDLTAMGRAVGQAWGNASTSFTTGIRPSRAAQLLADPTKYDSVRPEAFGGKSGLIATPALRIMSATDEFMRTLNAAGGLAVAARREARTTGKTVQEVLSEPSDQVLKFAQDAADAAVFEGQGSPFSKIVGSWRNLINSSDPKERAAGVVGHVLFPFVHIPEQILIRGTKMLPGANELTTIMSIRKGLQSGDKQQVRDAIGRYILTDAVLLAAGSQVLAGNITGMGPKDAQKRAALDAARDADGNKVWQAHSVRVGDRWIDYTNLGPVAIPLSVLSNAHEAYLESGKKPGATEVADVFNRVAATMLDATYIKSFGDLMKGISEGNIVKAGGSLIGNTVTRAVPYGGFLAQFERITDQERKNPRNLPEYVASRVPLASELVPDKPSPFGGATQESQDVLAVASPFKTSAAGLPDPVARAFVGAGMGAPGAPDSIRIQSQMTGNSTPPIKLTEDEKVEYTRILGDRLAQQLGSRTADPSWQRMAITGQKAALESVLRAARDYTEAQLYRRMTTEDRQKRMQEGRTSLQPAPLR